MSSPLSINPKLLEERSKVKFDVDELSTLLFGSKDELNSFLKMQEYMDSTPIQQHDPDFCGLSREQKISSYIKKFQDYHHKFNFNKESSLIAAFAFFNEPLITSLHQVMFIPCLKSLTNQKQYEKW